ncbi:MAG: DNA alkylation repair protein [Bacteroidota bacterium]|nr:DNA alkylation repair protein [Bacteroidota bacterium]
MDFSEELKKLKADFLTNQNGVVVELMENRGLRYEINYGLSSFQIKSIVKKYLPNQDFADFLFQQEIREAKLISFYLSIPEKFDEKKLDNLVDNLFNAELVEQACMNLLDKVEASAKNLFKYCQNDNEFVKMTGYLLLARLSQMGQKFSNSNLNLFFKFVKKDIFTKNPSVRNSIGRALRVVAGKSQYNKTNVLQVCHYCENSKHPGALWIAEEVKLGIGY